MFGQVYFQNGFQIWFLLREHPRGKYSQPFLIVRFHKLTALFSKDLIAKYKNSKSSGWKSINKNRRIIFVSIKKIWISWDIFFVAFSEGQKSVNKNRHVNKNSVNKNRHRLYNLHNKNAECGHDTIFAWNLQIINKFLRALTSELAFQKFQNRTNSILKKRKPDRSKRSNRFKTLSGCSGKFQFRLISNDLIYFIVMSILFFAKMNKIAVVIVKERWPSPRNREETFIKSQ